MLPLTEADRVYLLGLARRTLELCTVNGGVPEDERPEGAVVQPCGAFVTLRRASDLRGCVGQVEPSRPLYTAVSQCAMAAALQDPRFDPVSPEEVPELNIEISVLSPPEDVSAESVEVGRHGLLISRGERRGVLLPQVPLEWHWDRERFLAETCRKAGLPRDAWKRGARIRVFTTEIFAEPDPAEPRSRRIA